MKKAVLIILAFISFEVLNAQSQLYGTWRGSCPAEKGKDFDSFKFCGLCPVTRTTDNITVDEFEIKIVKEELKIDSGKGLSKVKYEWDPADQSITFDYNKEHYQFNLITSGDDLHVLKSKDGLTLILNKK